MPKAILAFILIFIISAIIYWQLDNVLAYVYFKTGYRQQMLKNYKQAVKYYDLAAKKKADYNKIYFFRALSRYYLNDLKGSIDDYTKVLKQIP